uniref:Uncharacterized protein n=1 Tax=Rhizophora mucronata TaxID=61149 RepID=A0A2P2PZT6_RHIMU
MQFKQNHHYEHNDVHCIPDKQSCNLDLDVAAFTYISGRIFPKFWRPSPVIPNPSICIQCSYFMI